LLGATSSLFMSLQQVEPAGIWHQQFNILLNEAIQADVKNTDAEFKMQGFRASDISIPAQKPTDVERRFPSVRTLRPITCRWDLL